MTILWFVYILHFPPFLSQNKAEDIFYSLESIAKCNNNAINYLALHYSETDAFLLPGDDLKNTHKPYSRNHLFTVFTFLFIQ